MPISKISIKTGHLESWTRPILFKKLSHKKTKHKRITQISWVGSENFQTEKFSGKSYIFPRPVPRFLPKFPGIFRTNIQLFKLSKSVKNEQFTTKLEKTEISQDKSGHILYTSYTMYYVRKVYSSWCLKKNLDTPHSSVKKCPYFSRPYVKAQLWSYCI